MSAHPRPIVPLIMSVRTVAAAAADVKQFRAIQEGLLRSGLLPAEQLADAAYGARGSNASHGGRYACTSHRWQKPERPSGHRPKDAGDRRPVGGAKGIGAPSSPQMGA